MEAVTTIELMAMLDDDADVVVVGVMDETEFDDGHIPGSHNIPVGESDFETRVAELAGSRTRKVIVYSTGPDDGDSTSAGERLESYGFSDVAEYEGGTLDWAETGYDLESL